MQASASWMSFAGIRGGFAHNVQSLRVVERLEKDGRGLNLTWEVRDGILNHRTSGNPATLEGKIVQLSDKIAYTNHDIDDAIRAGMLKPREYPKGYCCAHRAHAPAAASMPWCGIPFFTAWASTISA